MLYAVQIVLLKVVIQAESPQENFLMGINLEKVVLVQFIRYSLLIILDGYLVLLSCNL